MRCPRGNKALNHKTPQRMHMSRAPFLPSEDHQMQSAPSRYGKRRPMAPVTILPRRVGVSASPVPGLRGSDSYLAGVIASEVHDLYDRGRRKGAAQRDGEGAGQARQLRV